VAGTAGLAAIAVWASRRFTNFRPIIFLLWRAPGLGPETRARVQKSFTRTLYRFLNRMMDGGDAGGFMNYGYAPTGASDGHLELPLESEDDRYSIQLYERVAGAVELRGLDVLEVGCGRGAGAAFLYEHFRPASLTGLDFVPASIDHARRNYARPGLEFVVGDAENLPFADASFDAVVNVESSHAYSDVSRFFREVARVLRPDGVLLFADMRSDLDELRAEIEAAGLTVGEEEDITANVARALELDSPRRRAMIERTAPPLIRSRLLEFSGVEGGLPYRVLASGEASYVRMVLRPVR
jgi:SAM-dependent methyltransferase